jgi:nitrogen fixation protein NifU and related proteins
VNDALRQLYQDVIVEHHKSPRNYGPLPGATHETTLVNPLCGDEVTVRLELEDERIAELRFESRGCVLSRAAASLMTEAVQGKTLAEASAIGRDLEAFVSAPPAPGAAERLGALTALEGVRDYPSRIGCVTLAWQALARTHH